MEPETEVQEAAKPKLHWTQKPENKKKLLAIQAKSVKARKVLPAALAARRVYCYTCGKKVGDKYYHHSAYPTHQLAVTKRVPGGIDESRSAFCFTCKRKFSNKYEHAQKHPTHKLDHEVSRASKHVGRPRGIISVLGSTVGQKSNGHIYTNPNNGSRHKIPESVRHEVVAFDNPEFVAGFKAGYEFRRGMESYAAMENISVETLAASAAQVLRKE